MDVDKLAGAEKLSMKYVWLYFSRILEVFGAIKTMSQ